MAPPLSDAVVVDALRRVDRLLSPAVTRLGRAPALPQDERDRWWADQVVARRGRGVGRAPVPGQAGRPAAVAEHRRHGRAVPRRPRRRPGARHHRPGRAGVPAGAGAARPRPAGRPGRAAAGAREGHLPRGRPRRTGPARRRPAPCGGPSRLLGRIDDALDARPKGKLRHRALSNLPVVGVVGGYAAEQEGLRRAARPRGRGPRRSASADSGAVGHQVGEHLTRRRRPVHGDEVDAGHALGQQASAQLGGDLDAERADGGLVLGRSPSSAANRSARSAGTPGRTAGRSG